MKPHLFREEKEEAEKEEIEPISSEDEKPTLEIQNKPVDRTNKLTRNEKNKKTIKRLNR